MDKSDQFVLMLTKAIEQHLDEFKDFDRTKNVQDQLQNMLTADGFVSNKVVVLDKLRAFIKSSFPVASWYNSMEQFLLAFVMSERFDKTWKGGEWTQS